MQYRPFEGRYVRKLTDFYGGNPTHCDPEFEDAEVRRTLRIVRLLYYTKILRFTWRKLRDRINRRHDVLVLRLYRWLTSQGSAMRAEDPYAKPLDTDDTTK